MLEVASKEGTEPTKAMAADVLKQLKEYNAARERERKAGKNKPENTGTNH